MQNDNNKENVGGDRRRLFGQTRWMDGWIDRSTVNKKIYSQALKIGQNGEHGAKREQYLDVRMKK